MIEKQHFLKQRKRAYEHLCLLGLLDLADMLEYVPSERDTFDMWDLLQLQQKTWQEEKEGGTTVNSGGVDRNGNGGDAVVEGVVSRKKKKKGRGGDKDGK